MSNIDQLNKAIDLLYSAATGEVEWSRPLQHLTELCGGAAATLELVDLELRQPIFFQSVGIDPASADDYLNHFQFVSPRISHDLQASSQIICCDQQFISEHEMDHDEFYADFLAPHNMRYYVSGTLEQTANRFGVFSVQRTDRQGHVDKDEIEIVARILPHIKRALDLTLRLGDTRDYSNQIERALDHHSEGVVLIAGDGSIAGANQAAREMFHSNSGLGICNKRIEFADRAAKKMLDSILQVLAKKNRPAAWPETEFLAARKSGGHPYALSVHPAHTQSDARSGNYLAIVFIRDLDRQQRLAVEHLQSIFGLTLVEARLANWIGQGRTLKAYGNQRNISMNTVYTHFRHLKEKTGSRSQMELVAKICQIAS
jgi:DNA-binding CsgD family transcriptional regulator